MSRYASNTSVSVEKSRAEIERTLERYGADQFSYGRDDSRGMSVIQFRARERQVRFVLHLPKRNDKKFTLTEKGKCRLKGAAQKSWELACRQQWRALALCIKSRLVTVESEIAVFDDEFMSNIILPDGKTAGEFLRPQIEKAYLSGKMPKSILMLPAPKG